jgi:hypothetical protein
MNFERFLFSEQFSTREILKAKLPEPGGESRWSSPVMRTDYLDAATGDIPWKPDSRAT